MLLTNKGLLFKYKRLERCVKKTVCANREVRRWLYVTKRFQRDYTSLTQKEPIVHRFEEFIKDEAFVSFIQILFGDDIGYYISNNMLSYYTDRISYTLMIITRDLGLRTIAHNFEHNSLVIVTVSYIIAILGLIMEESISQMK